jgi:hypothetical protein
VTAPRENVDCTGPAPFLAEAWARAAAGLLSAYFYGKGENSSKFSGACRLKILFCV